MNNYFAICQILLTVLIGAMPFFASAKESESAIPDIRTLPRLSAGLRRGTLAWATIDQLHPTQEQTGMREVRRKAKDFKKLILDAGEGRFPDELYKMMLKKYIIPVYVAKTPEYDSRYGREESLGYVTDRTHKAAAMSRALTQIYGKSALSKPLYSKHNRVVNFVLVRVMEDKSDLDSREFNDFMVKNNHCYLKHWSPRSDGSVKFSSIKFIDLPEKVYETNDNPFRSLIGEMQSQKLLGRSPIEFSQFIDAEALARSGLISWKDISPDVSDDDYDAAMQKASDFFKSPEAIDLPGVKSRDCQRRLESAGSKAHGR